MLIQKKKIGYPVLNWNSEVIISSGEVIIMVEYVTLR